MMFEKMLPAEPIEWKHFVLFVCAFYMLFHAFLFTSHEKKLWIHVFFTLIYLKKSNFIYVSHILFG
uniref:Uncharacterized protein n=1 Tax=Octopus bimaculoides TaxID=37653 RepID=A0A0L8GX44_OCTBM